ncbi:MAG: hypothetical protein V4631_07555 [Pseudomonadota bacterium]
MKKIFTAGFLSLLALSAQAKAPSQRIIDSCLSTDSTSKSVRYAHTKNFSVNEIKEVDDDHMGAEKLSTVVEIGKDTFGVWTSKAPKGYGLVYNEKEMPLHRVIRLDNRYAPVELNLYKSIYGIAREGSNSYLCVTFNFDGLGESGSYQNIRGVYLVDRTARPFKAYYAAGNISNIEK